MTAPDDATRVVSSSERAEQWKVNVGGDEVVSMTSTEIFSALRAGRATTKTLVWRKGMGEWTELGQVPSLALLVPRPDENASVPPPSASPVAASGPTSAPKPGDSGVSASPKSSATHRAALPRERDPSSRTNLSAVRTTAPPVPRAAGRASMASIHPGAAPPPSAPLAAMPPAPAPTSAADLKDIDDDDEGVTQIHTTQNLLGMMSPSAPKPPAEAARPDEGKAIAVYERPVATLAFAEGVKEVAEAPAPAAPPPPPQRSVAPARIIAIGASAPAPAAPPPPQASAPAPALAAPPPSAPVSAPAQAASASLPASLPSVMVAQAPAPVPSAIPDSLEPVTKHDELTSPGGQTRAGRRRKLAINRTVLVASVGSAVVASLFTALLVRRSEPTPLVVAPSVASPVAKPVVPQPAAPAREPEPSPAGSAVPVMDLSALPEDVEAPKPAPRREIAPAESPAAKFAELAPETERKPKRAVAEANPFEINLDEDEPAAPAKAPSTPTESSDEAPAAAPTTRPSKPRATSTDGAPAAPPAQAPASPPSQSPGF